ncbi:cytochrome b/b6 domain-containing protein [Fluviispira sanaruensis]|uniref:Cytochrome b561 n=1 Tax=Fluviispira sanaruensis TaxID=2493639 RepID=A0A4P2VUB2_FLUSA|nr:cytochrome b/b6 domain-containing protein [Fluviispira sanaruensis]BBH53055.1 cytochrome b561 [Fluviispira sanaruensis]
MNTENIKEREYIFVEKYVYDPILRILHWVNALSIFSLMLTIWLKNLLKPYDNWKEILYRYHILIGYVLTAGIILRVVWGFIGPEHAKFKNMINWKAYLKLLRTRKYDTSENWGHNKYAGLSYIFLFILMLYQAYSGLYLAAQKYEMSFFHYFVEYSAIKTPFAKLLSNIHEIVFYMTMIFTALHVIMLRFHEIISKSPLTQAMCNGIQYRKKNKS